MCANAHCNTSAFRPTRPRRQVKHSPLRPKPHRLTGYNCPFFQIEVEYEVGLAGHFCVFRFTYPFSGQGAPAVPPPDLRSFVVHGAAQPVHAHVFESAGHALPGRIGLSRTGAAAAELAGHPR